MATNILNFFAVIAIICTTYILSTNFLLHYHYTVKSKTEISKIISTNGRTYLNRFLIVNNRLKSSLSNQPITNMSSNYNNSTLNENNQTQSSVLLSVEVKKWKSTTSSLYSSANLTETIQVPISFRRNASSNNDTEEKLQSNSFSSTLSSAQLQSSKLTINTSVAFQNRTSVLTTLDSSKKLQNSVIIKSFSLLNESLNQVQITTTTVSSTTIISRDKIQSYILISESVGPKNKLTNLVKSSNLSIKTSNQDQSTTSIMNSPIEKFQNSALISKSLFSSKKVKNLVIIKIPSFLNISLNHNSSMLINNYSTRGLQDSTTSSEYLKLLIYKYLKSTTKSFLKERMRTKSSLLIINPPKNVTNLQTRILSSSFPTTSSPELKSLSSIGNYLFSNETLIEKNPDSSLRETTALNFMVLKSTALDYTVPESAVIDSTVNSTDSGSTIQMSTVRNSQQFPATRSHDFELFEQSICYNNMTYNYSIKRHKCPKRNNILFMEQIGHLGFTMWGYACVWAISRENKNLKAYIPRCIHSILNKIFVSITIPSLEHIVHCHFNADGVINFFEFVKQRDPRVFSPNYSQFPVIVMKYLKALRKEFTFRKELKFYADEVFRTLGKLVSGSPVFIGVYIRRTQAVGPYQVIHESNTGAGPEYFFNAMSYFEFKYPSAVFIVVTDDIEWCTVTFRNKKNLFIASTWTSTDSEDLAVLSLCNHTILDRGMFGQWGALLAGGETIISRYKSTSVMNQIAALLPNWHTLTKNNEAYNHDEQ